MRVGLLGPLEVRGEDSAAVAVPGARLRTLLIMLALEPGRVVPTATLVDGIWSEDPPAGAANALQALVSRLRRSLPGVRVESDPAGYRLAIAPEAVDAIRFERLAAAGRAALPGDPAAAARSLREALDLWRGPALPEVADRVRFRAVVARLSELRLAAAEDWAEAELRPEGGDPTPDLATELTSLVAAHPLRERLVAALMRALSAAGRSGDALAAYARAREALAEALGADPSPALTTLHTAILRGGHGPAAPPPGTGARTNLRAGLTRYVSRGDEVARVGKLVGEHRLTTLTGPGGSGKTRLAVEVARTLVDQTPDGVWLVELAPVGSAADLPQAVLAAMGVREAVTGRGPAGDPADRLAAALGTTDALLVLDNCEHLIDAAAALADRLLGVAPRLRILATSRELLGITGEALWPVEPLAVPPPGADATGAMAYPAVRLLADRAHAASPGFAVTAATVPALVRLCRALDGMPLAIELAAARLRTMTLPQLADRLDDRFRLLTGGSRRALPRHQTLRAVVDWSWELLSAPERALLRRLAVFTGGATAAAAERVCADAKVPADRVLDLLTALADKSLLVTAGAGDPGEDPPRYRMLETTRAYGLERLDDAGERDRIRRAHADYFLALAEEADPHLRRAEQLRWLARLSPERGNLTAAVRGAIAAGDASTAVRLVAAAGWFWWIAGEKAQGAELAAAALAAPGPVDEEAYATAAAIAAMFATAGMGDDNLDGWLRTVREAGTRTDLRHPLLRFLGPLEALMSSQDGAPPPLDALDPLLTDEDPWVRGNTRLNRAKLLLTTGTPQPGAEREIEAALAEFRSVGERWGTSFALTLLADLVAQRDPAAAIPYYEEAVRVLAELGTLEDTLHLRVRLAQLRWLRGDEPGSAAALAEAERDAARVAWPDALAGMALGRADLARWTGDPAAARARLVEAEALLAHISIHPAIRAMLHDSWGYLDAHAGDLAGARTRRAEALPLALRAADVPAAGQVLVGVADLALRQGRPRDAARLLAASAAVRGGPDRSRPDGARVEAAVRAALGERELAEATRDGHRATLETVPELAAPILDPPPEDPQPTGSRR